MQVLSEWNSFLLKSFSHIYYAHICIENKSENV